MGSVERKMVKPSVLDLALRELTSLPLGIVATRHYCVVLCCFIFFLSLNHHLEYF